MQYKKTLRVGYFSPGWPLSDYPNGIVAYIVNILSGLDTDIKANVLTANVNQADVDDIVIDIAKYRSKYVNYPSIAFAKLLPKLACNNAELVTYKNILRDTGSSIRSAMSAAKEPLDIVEMEESFGLNYYVINKKTKARFVTRLHGPWFTMEKIFNLKGDEQFKRRVFFEGEGIKRAYGITAPSLDVLEKVRAYYNIDLPDARVIPNPVLMVEKPNQWQINAETPYILFVGRFDSHKGGDLIIDSFNIVAQSNKEVQLYIVGPDRGFVVDGVLLNINQYINKQISNESIRQRIIVHGHCHAEQISRLRQRARVTVFCSRYETFGISLVEALAAGCPTVATAVGGIKEIIVDGFNGVFAEPESPESIAEKTLMLLSDEKMSKQLSENAIKDAGKRFSCKNIAAQTVDYYKSILNR